MPAQRHVSTRGRDAISSARDDGCRENNVADLLATASVSARDSDRDIEKITGRTGRQIAEEGGVDKLHSLEEWSCSKGLHRYSERISGAGGVIESSRVEKQCRVNHDRVAEDLSGRPSYESRPGLPPTRPVSGELDQILCVENLASRGR